MKKVMRDPTLGVMCSDSRVCKRCLHYPAMLKVDESQENRIMDGKYTRRVTFGLVPELHRLCYYCLKVVTGMFDTTADQCNPERKMNYVRPLKYESLSLPRSW